MGNLCVSCKLDFGSVAAFDQHRTGVHDYTFAEGLNMEPERLDGRRCLDEDEMRASGFVLNRRGTWSLQKTLTQARERFSDEPLSAEAA